MFFVQKWKSTVSTQCKNHVAYQHDAYQRLWCANYKPLHAYLYTLGKKKRRKTFETNIFFSSMSDFIWTFYLYDLCHYALDTIILWLLLLLFDTCIFRKQSKTEMRWQNICYSQWEKNVCIHSRRYCYQNDRGKNSRVDGGSIATREIMLVYSFHRVNIVFLCDFNKHKCKNNAWQFFKKFHCYCAIIFRLKLEEKNICRKCKQYSEISRVFSRLKCNKIMVPKMQMYRVRGREKIKQRTNALSLCNNSKQQHLLNNNAFKAEFS